jgi:O-succinylbenzoic acid--CoA ligase
MTETLSHIAMRRLSGKDASEWYTPMPGVSLSQDPDGCLIINAPALNPETLITNDIVVLRQDGTFRIIGRRDNVICSGGVKLQIEEIERELQPLLFSPFMITKKKDPKFGEIVVLLTEGDTEQAKAQLSKMTNKFSKPKLIIHIDKLPLTETGKPARARAMELVSK